MSVNKMADRSVSCPRDTSLVNPDFQDERDKSSLNIAEITNIIDGGKDATDRRHEIENLLFNDPDFKISQDIYRSKQEKYAANMKRSVKLIQMQRDGIFNEESDFKTLMRVLHYCYSFGLHKTMFIPAIERLGSEEQKAKWLPLAKSYQIIGTYAQTEMGHGTYLMELETTATYDTSSEEFVLNTPKQSSMKWWPGNLGKTANIAIILAQLMINGTRYGMHPFLVQLRCFEDHKLMPGVQAGDIGPKLGGNYFDNGFLVLTNVRIPRNNMLMKNAQVTKAGKFVSTSHSKANYATMVYVRVEICLWCCGVLGSAVTCALRYSAVRRQSTLQAGGKENKILDYQTQQFKLFPALSISYCAFTVYKLLSSKYQTMLVEIRNGSYKSLPEMHIISSGMKALLSDLVTGSIETIRRSCGGHGYLLSAGIADMVVESLPLVTVEGENTVLYLQVARYLIKQLAKSLSGKPCSGTTEYLNMNPGAFTCPIQNLNDCRNVEFLCQIYKKRAYSTIFDVAQRLQGDIEKGVEQHTAMNNNLQDLVRAATAHCYVLALSDFLEAVTTLPVSPPTRKVLYTLCNFFGVHHLVLHSGNFLETEAISLEQLQLIKKMELQLLTEIRPDAIRLVDAFDFHDETLSSAIGSWDGRAYERLYEAAMLEPMNAQEVDPAYYKYQSLLKIPEIKAKL